MQHVRFDDLVATTTALTLEHYGDRVPAVVRDVVGMTFRCTGQHSYLHSVRSEPADDQDVQRFPA